ncbi:UNVERIFIED_CONTAM: hypothetical protein FKN15_045733 [Acipenser sinensis]
MAPLPLALEKAAMTPLPLALEMAAAAALHGAPATVFPAAKVRLGGVGLLTSPPSSWSAAALHGAPATVFLNTKVRLGELVS